MVSIGGLYRLLGFSGHEEAPIQGANRGFWPLCCGLKREKIRAAGWMISEPVSGPPRSVYSP